MGPQGSQEASETSPLNARQNNETGIAYGSSTENDGGAQTTSNGLFGRGASDLRGSMRSIRALVNEHTGTTIFLFASLWLRKPNT